MTDPDRIHRNAQKAAAQWQSALGSYTQATAELVEIEADIRTVRRSLKDVEMDAILAGTAMGITGKNTEERKAQLHVALRNSDGYRGLLDDEARLEQQAAAARQAADTNQEAMKMAAAILRYATEERRESAERLATGGGDVG